MNPSGVILSVRDQLYENTEGYYSDAELYRYLSQAEVLVANSVGCTYFASGILTTGGIREYAKPSGSLYITRLSYDSYPLIKISQNDVDLLEGASYGKIAPSGNPTHYYETSSVVGLSSIPDAAKSLTFIYSKMPEPLTASSTTFSIPEQYADYLADYVLYRAFLKDQDSRAGTFLQIWESNLKQLKSDYKKSQRTNKTTVVKDSSQIYTGNYLGVF